MGDSGQKYCFSGTYTPKIDGKGRLTIPSSLRKELGDDVVLMKSESAPCIEVLPRPSFVSLLDIFRASPHLFDDDVEAWREAFLADCLQTTIDGQGRVLIPPDMREYAGLETDVVVTGDMEKLKVWSPQRWDERRRAARDRNRELRAHVREKFQVQTPR